MGFTTPCFIRKNSKELQNKLADIGYKFTCFPSGDALVTENERSLAYIEKLSNVPYYGIEEDCGTNEELFLAIAALRDDSDIHQWFVNDVDQHWVNLGLYMPKGSFELCLIDDKYMHQDGLHLTSAVPSHKATVEELIKHFTKH